MSSITPHLSTSTTNPPLTNAEPVNKQEVPKVVHIKLVLLGEAAVGKSSLVIRFANDEFQDNREPTIGAAFLTQKIILDDKTIKCEIWDTAGQERFATLAPMYYRNAQAAIVVYDITKPASFLKAKHWVNELAHQASPKIVIALAGNKLDLAEDTDSTPPGTVEVESEENADPEASVAGGRQVAQIEASNYAKDNGLLFYETSAKTGTNVLELFTEIAKKLPLDQIISNRNARGVGLNSGNGRVDLLRENGGADAFSTGAWGDRSQASTGRKNGCC